MFTTFVFFFIFIELSYSCFENFTTASLENQLAARVKDLIASKDEIPKR